MNPIYDPKVPKQPTDSLATSQPDLMANFQSLFNIFGNNHVSLDAGATAGNHTIIQLIELDNVPQTSPTEISIYVNKVEGQTDQVFLQYGGNGQEVQMTNYQIYSLTGTSPNSYFTFLPGKMIAYFGSFVKLPNNQLILQPGVAIHIISMAFCPIGTISNFKPKVTLQQPSNEFYTTINVFAAAGINVPAPSCYYFVLANF